jgi:glycosyltransferase involved in cell wall biosynthesis
VRPNGEFDYQSTADRGPQLLGLPTSGHSGLYVPVGEPQALAAAIRRLIDDSDLAVELGTEARRTVLSSFTIERFVQTLATAIHGKDQQPSASTAVEATV